MVRPVLTFLGRHATAAMALGVFSGLAVPAAARLLDAVLTPAVWALLVLAFLRIDWSAIVHHMRRPLLAAAIVAWTLAATPLLVWLALGPFDLPPGLVAAAVMAAGSSSTTLTPAVGMILGLDGGLLLVVLVVSTLVLPLTLPVLALGLLGLDLSIDAAAMTLRLGMFVATAVGAALAAQRVVGRARLAAAHREIDGVSVVLLILFAIAIMDGITARLLADPGRVAAVTALSFAVYAALFVVGAATFRLLLRVAAWRLALSAAFASGTRNLAVLLAVLPAAADPDIRVYFALGQFPIYIMPAVLKPILARLLSDDASVQGGPAS